MRSRRLLHAILGIAIAILVGAFLTWAQFQPPKVLVDPGSADSKARLVLDDVIVVNPGFRRRPHRRVEVVGNRIMRIADSVSESRTRNNHDVAGLYALPGLIDMHVHLPPDTGLHQAELFGFLFLAHGVTSVREMGSLDGSSLEQRRRGRERDLTLPRIFACGFFVDGDPPTWPNSQVAVTRAQGRAAVDRLVGEEVDCVKVYSSLPAEALTGVREQARKHGLKVVGHVPNTVPLENALLDDVQHLRGVFAPGLADPWIDPDPDAIKRVVRTSLEHGLSHTPTLVVFEQLARMSDYASLRASPVSRLLPRLYRDVVWHPTEGLPFLRKMTDKDFAEIAAQQRGRMQMVQALHAAGVDLHAGTDVQTPFVVPGASLHRELGLLVEAGIPVEEVWALATRGAGEFLGVPLLGTVQVGAPADLLLFSEDPTLDLRALSTLEAVVSDGRLYPRAELDRGLDLYRAQFESFFFDTLSVEMGRFYMQRFFD